MRWWLLRPTVKIWPCYSYRLFAFRCDSKKISYSWLFSRLTVKICQFFRLTDKILRYVPKCMQQWKWRKFPKIVKSAELISLWRSWLNRQSIKSDEIVKSINIYSVWRNFVKSTIFVTPCNTGLKWKSFSWDPFSFLPSDRNYKYCSIVHGSTIR